MESPLTPPPHTHLHESRIPGLLFANVFTFSFALIIVILRFVSRRLSHLPFWWDDYLMLPALVAAAVLFFTDTVYMVNNGLGRHIYVAPDPPTAAVRWAIGLFVTEISYTLTIVMVKFSVLVMYWRIFRESKTVRIAIYVLGGVVAAWGVAFLLVTIFDCSPVKGAWTRFSMEAVMNPAMAPVCRVQAEPAYLSNSAINIVTDIAILILPMYQVWQLNLPRAQKLAVCGIFAIGIFDIGVAISRFVFIIQFELNLLKSLDVTWTFVNTQIWSAVEINTGIICSSLASLRPLLNLILYGSVDRPDSGSSRSPKARTESTTPLQKPRSRPRKSSQNSGSFFEQHRSILGSVRSWSSRSKDRIRMASAWPAHYLRMRNDVSGPEVRVGSRTFTMITRVDHNAPPANVSRQVSVRKASLRTQEEIKKSVQKAYDGISVWTEIDVDGESDKSKGPV
ncbi:MAG: hypothetical protein Q9157_007634 [Trypethelium eluteriae]